MSADSFLRMGSTHSICQDYCLAGVTEEGVSYALLSDGCSDAGGLKTPGAPFTDFGSRFLVRAAQQRVKYISAAMAVPLTEIATEAASMVRVSRLPGLALNATLLGVVKDPASKEFLTWMSGDGVLVIRHRDGKVTYQSLEFESNMPYYPSYVIDPDKEASWKAASGKALATHGVLDPTTKEWHSLNLEVVPQSVIAQTHSIEDVDMVLLFSDGVSSFHNGQLVGLHAVLDQLLDFKGGYVGQFLARRCNSFMTRFCVANNWKHTDDFSVSGLYFEAP